MNRTISEYNYSEPQNHFRISRVPAKAHTYGVLFRKKYEGEEDGSEDQMLRAIGWDQWREPMGKYQLHLSDARQEDAAGTTD